MKIMSLGWTECTMTAVLKKKRKFEYKHEQGADDVKPQGTDGHIQASRETRNSYFPLGS